MKNKQITKKLFNQWMLGMLVKELEVSLDDIPKILKLQKCTKDIIEFAEEYNLFKNN